MQRPNEDPQEQLLPHVATNLARLIDAAPTSGIEHDEQVAFGYPPVLTVDELAALLRVERKTAYAAIARGDIPGAHRVGRNIRILRDAVLEWLRTQAHAPRSRRIR